MRCLLLSSLLLATSFAALVACSATNGAPAAGGKAGSGGTGAGNNGQGGQGAVFFDSGIDSPDDAQSNNCADGTAFVYVVDRDNGFHRFDPQALSLTNIGTLNCTNTAQPYSMSVDRSGRAWVVYDDGNIYWVDILTAKCSPSGFTPNQHGFKTFGMGFSADIAGGDAETLFVSGAPNSGTTEELAMINPATLALTPVGKYDALSSDRAEMTGTGDARLFGAFEGSPYVVAEIEKTTAHIISQAPQSQISYQPDSSNFAFAFWGGTFWIFVGPGTSTDVFHYDPTANTTQKVQTFNIEIVGAGVSTCAPVEPPK